MSQSQYLHGLHDLGGEYLMEGAPGWIVESIALSETDRRDYANLAQQGFGVIARLNHAHNGREGTIPLQTGYRGFAAACAKFVALSSGVSIFIIGNEPNHLQERPNGVTILPGDYARCFDLCYEAIKQANPAAQVLVAAVAPWNQSTGDWLSYQTTVLDLIAACDGLALHAYTHGADPQLIRSDQKVNGWLWDFRVYRQMLGIVPLKFRELPVFITETNQGDHAWLDVNNGWVKNAYAEIDSWNQTPGTQKIKALCLYRWKKHDKYSIEDKGGVQMDFREAVERGYRSPESAQTAYRGSTVTLPWVGTGKAPNEAPGPAVPSLPPREIDLRLTARGMKVEDAAVAPGESHWRLVKAQWFNKQEAGGRHNVFVEALDSQGNPIFGMPFTIRWPDGEDTYRTKAGRGFNAGDAPLSPGQGAFTVFIATDKPSDVVSGIGMGADTPDGFNPGIHTATLLTFQEVTQPMHQQPPVDPVQPAPTPHAGGLHDLAHPVADARYRAITQIFGVNGDGITSPDYSKFSVDGVPLKGHNGLDFRTPIGSQIVAVDDGVVVEVAEDPQGYGKYVKLRHPWGESLYAHLSRQDARVGQSVVRGSQVGLSGNSGNSTGPHLHFGMRVNPFNRRDGWGGYSDPYLYLYKNKGIEPDLTPARGLQAPGRPSVDLLDMIWNAAYNVDLDRHVLTAQVMRESSFNPKAVSSAGAKGLMQIMPATWDEWVEKLGMGAADIFDPEQNLRVGAAYLAHLIKTLKGQYGDGATYMALIAYGWGIGNLLAKQEEPPLVWRFYASEIMFGAQLLKGMERLEL